MNLMILLSVVVGFLFAVSVLKANPQKGGPLGI